MSLGYELTCGAETQMRLLHIVIIGLYNAWKSTKALDQGVASAYRKKRSNNYWNKLAWAPSSI